MVSQLPDALCTPLSSVGSHLYRKSLVVYAQIDILAPLRSGAYGARGSDRAAYQGDHGGLGGSRDGFRSH